MILFVTPKPQTYMPLDAEKFFSGSYHSYFFYQLYNQKINTKQIKLLFLEDYDEKKLTKDVKIIVPLGKEAWKRFNPKLSLDKARGSIFEEEINGVELFLIPTFHPEELKHPYTLFMDASIEKSYFFIYDLRKIRYTLEHGYTRPEERFNLAPSMADVEQFIDKALSENLLLGTDIEATGLNIEYAQIVCIGFAWNQENAIVIPLTKEHGVSYWKGDDLRKIINLLNKLFQGGRFMFQNGIGYDVPLLRARGFNFPLENFKHDTMLLHHSINPELKHNIGLISSLYGRQPYWKNSFLTRKEHIFETDQLEMRRYNARDCVALWQVYEPLQLELSEKGLEDVYELEMGLCAPIIEMQENGLLIDENKLKTWQGYLNRELKKEFQRLNEIKKLPNSFNYSSGDHLAWLFYGKQPPQFAELEDSLKKYEKHYTYGYRCSKCTRKINLKLHYKEKPKDAIERECPKCKERKLFRRTEDEKKEAKPKSKTSSDYLKLKALKEISQIQPFNPPNKFSPPRTAKGAYATDKIALIKYLIAVNKRLEELEFLKRRTEHHAQENKDLLKLQNYIECYQKYNALQTLKNGFYTFKTWKDGRVRPKILIQGTATGRFSCKSPNLQQMPAHHLGAKMRNIFRAGEGRTLLSIDFSNLEVQVGARFMDDEAMIKILEKGQNIHDENTKTFFGVDKRSSLWKPLRDAAKKIQFGRLYYGGTDNGMYPKIMVEVPDCGLTLKKFKEAVQNWMNQHPAYKPWVDKMLHLAHNERVSINAYGRKRYLYGDHRSIERQALNTPIQGSSADTINQDIILIYQELKKRNLKSKMALAVHDELIFECYNEELKEVYEIASQIMNRERQIGKHKFRIPIDAEIGQHWGSLGGFNPETMEVIGESKH